MKYKFKTKYFFSFILIILAVLFFLSYRGTFIFSGQVKSIDRKLPCELRETLKKLVARDPDDVLSAMHTIKKMDSRATAAIPYLVPLLEDRRLAKIKIYGFVKFLPLFKEAAIVLGGMEEQGIKTLIDSLEGMRQQNGFGDDFMREAVAEGLRFAMEQWGALAFKRFENTERAKIIIETIETCKGLVAKPGIFDKSDPRNNLKFYKHFPDCSDREGLKTYIMVSGLIGDKRALGALSTIASLSEQSKNNVKLKTGCLIQREALIAQYKINPPDLKEILPIPAKMIFIDFIACGDLPRVKKFLDQGISPDTETITGEPVICLAFKKKHRDIVDLLVEKGACIDYRLSGKDTLLIRAAGKGDYQFVKMLLEKGADPLLINNAKETALIASFKEFIEFWDGKTRDKEAEPWLNIFKLLTDAGSPGLPEALLSSLDKKSIEILEFKPGE